MQGQAPPSTSADAAALAAWLGGSLDWLDGDAVRHGRMDSGVPEVALLSAAGLSLSNWRRLLTGRNEPTLELVVALGACSDIAVATLRLTHACCGPASRPSFASVSNPRCFVRADLHEGGFVGWRTWAELRASAFEEIPRTAGTYLVYRPSAAEPEFLEVGTGGLFKGRDPNVPVATLRAKWVSGAHTLYLGKGDKLRTRLRTYAKFGAGDPKAAHWGGRYIWQLADADELLVAWRDLGENFETARLHEIALLARFAELHNSRRPFANLTG